jgi:hypothetical protein
MITPVLINRIGWKTFLVWMALAFSFVPIIHFFYVETSNISLEGMFFLPVPPSPFPKTKEANEKLLLAGACKGRKIDLQAADWSFFFRY